MGTYCIEQGTLPNALGWPKWEGSPKGRGYLYVYGWFIMLCSAGKHNSVKQPYSNKNWNKKRQRRETKRSQEEKECNH